LGDHHKKECSGSAMQVHGEGIWREGADMEPSAGLGPGARGHRLWGTGDIRETRDIRCGAVCGCGPRGYKPRDAEGGDGVKAIWDSLIVIWNGFVQSAETRRALGPMNKQRSRVAFDEWGTGAWGKQRTVPLHHPWEGGGP
jgi:hypothetical protein